MGKSMGGSKGLAGGPGRALVWAWGGGGGSVQVGFIHREIREIIFFLITIRVSLKVRLKIYIIAIIGRAFCVCTRASTCQNVRFFAEYERWQIKVRIESRSKSH